MRNYGFSVCVVLRHVYFYYCCFVVEGIFLLPLSLKKVAANEHFLPDVLECWEQGQLVQKLAM